MYTFKPITLAVLIVSCIIGGPKTLLGAGQGASSSPDVEQILEQLRATLFRVQSEISAKKLPALRSVQITLQTGIRTTGGGKVTFFVVSLGDTLTSDKVQTLKITLLPPKINSSQVSATQDFSKEFSNAVIAVSETIAGAEAQEPKLKLSNLFGVDEICI